MYNRLTDEVFKCVDGRFDKNRVVYFRSILKMCLSSQRLHCDYFTLFQINIKIDVQ